ncbi:NAC domain containing protein 20 [Euphorbia peplus]|nr:NAC domain containing protein 20 [Euphorbia peplus]
MALPRFATGYRFRPTDQELVCYLFMKLSGRSLSPAGITMIPESNLHGKKEPWEIFDEFGPTYIPFYGSDDLFFFSKLNKKTQNSSKNVDRRVGISGGFWLGQDSGKTIIAEVKIEQQQVRIQGVKKRFRYTNKNPVQRCGWIMFEFSLPQFDGETVLCRLRKNNDVVATCKNVDEFSNKKRTTMENDNVVVKALARVTCNAEVEPAIKWRKLNESGNNAQINPGLELNITADDDSARFNVVEDHGSDDVKCGVECGGDDDVQTVEDAYKDLDAFVQRLFA